MGLDLYSGPLTRYYSGSWQTSMQQLGAQVVYADGAAPWIDKESAKERVRDFHARLAEKLASFEFTLPEWNEADDCGYETNKPSYDAHAALVLWSAYIIRRDLRRPRTLSADITTDRAYREALGKQYYEPHLITLDSDIFVPAKAGFALGIENPLGMKQLISSTQSLMDTLTWINEQSWAASPEDVDKWLRRGPPHDESFELTTSSTSSPLAGILSFVKKKLAAPQDRLALAAQYGFACYSQMLAFSVKNNVPIKTDM